MPVDKRCDEQRIDIARPVELLDPEVGLGVTGYTKNLSPSGMRARLDMAPSTGNNLELAINLADGTSPLETHGEVMWCVPDSRGEGAEIGLRFTSEVKENSIDITTLPADILPELPTIRLGQRLKLDAIDNIIEVTVEEIVQNEALPRGIIQLNLSVEGVKAADNSPATLQDKTDEDLLASAELWKPHPMRDLRKWFKKYVGPPVVVALAIAAPCAKFIGLGLNKAFSLLPNRIKQPLLTIFSRLRLRENSGRILQRCRELGAGVRSKIAVSKERHLSN